MASKISLFFVFFVGIVVFEVDMAFLDVDKFFNVNGNLTKISWAHAVNNKSLLNEALSSDVMMLEADVVVGNVTGTNQTNVPVMAHPPAVTSDLSLQNFLQEVLVFNTDSTRNRTKKGVKLDFKSIEAFEGSLDIINSNYPNMDYPVWINADILSGPVNATGIPVNATRFFSNSRPFLNSTLSIGWTTNWGANSTGSYTNSHVNDMLAAISNNAVNQSVTFPVRAGIAANSIPQMQSLLANVGNSTMTLWSSEGDSVNVTNLRNLIRAVGINRTFIDVPVELERQLNLRNLTSGGGLPTLMKLLFVSCVLYSYSVV